MRKGCAWVGLSAVAAAFTVGFMGVESAIAEIAFSLDDISNDILRQVNQPDMLILLPSPEILDESKSYVGKGDILYAHVDRNNSEGRNYRISFNNRPGDPGDAAFRFGFSAVDGGVIEKIRSKRDDLEGAIDYPATYSQIKLVDGSKALTASWCGGIACWSSVQWKSDDILYKVTTKLSKPNIAIKIANSAIKAGNRNSKRKVVKPSSSDSPSREVVEQLKKRSQENRAGRTNLAPVALPSLTDEQKSFQEAWKKVDPNMAKFLGSWYTREFLPYYSFHSMFKFLGDCPITETRSWF
jgi:hypothetical protein